MFGIGKKKYKPSYSVETAPCNVIFADFTRKFGVLLDNYNKSHENYPFQLMAGPGNDINSMGYLPDYLGMAIYARPYDVSEEFILSTSVSRMDKRPCYISAFRDYYERHLAGRLSNEEVVNNVVKTYYDSHVKHYAKEHGFKPRRPEPKKVDSKKVYEEVYKKMQIKWAKELGMDFYENFVKALNKYNATHENYPIVFHAESNKDQLNIRAYPENAPAEIINDRNHPEYEMFSKMIACNMYVFFGKYFEDHEFDPGILDEHVRMWYTTYVVNKFAVQYNIPPRNTIFASFRKGNGSDR